MKRWQLVILLCVAIIATDIAFGQGCSQCKLVAEQGSELDEDAFGSNINYGILYLMAMPYIILLIIFRKKIYALIKNLVKKA